MQIIVKILSGPESKMEIEDSISVLQLKRFVADKFEVPVEHQRLMFKGKSLQDDNTVMGSGVQEGSKIILSMKAGSKPKPVAPSHGSNRPDLWQELHQFLVKHYSDQDTRLIMEEFQKDMHKIVNSLSLDDIERLATVNLQRS